jgi:hypothetical protein
MFDPVNCGDIRTKFIRQVHFISTRYAKRTLNHELYSLVCMFQLRNYRMDFVEF